MNKMTEPLEDESEVVAVGVEESIRKDIEAEINRVDMDLGQGEDFRLPAFMRLESAAITAWNWWYGSPRAAMRAAENLKQVRTPEAQIIQKKYRRSHPLVLLSVAAANPLVGQVFFSNLPPELQAQTEPERRLSPMLSAVLGEDGACFRMISETFNAEKMAAIVEQAWPFMAEVHERGGYAPGLSTMLVAAAMLKDKLAAEKITSQEKQRLLLTVNMLLRNLPPRLAGLLGIYAPAFNAASQHTYKVYGVTHQTLDPEKSFWSQTTEPVLDDTVRYLLRGGMPGPSPFGDTFDELLRLETQIVSAMCLGRRIGSLYKTFSEQASVRYSQLRESIQLYSRSLDVPFSADIFPADLVGRPLPPDCLLKPAVLQAGILSLIVAEREEGDIQRFITDAEERMVSVRTAHQRIAELNSSPSISAMMEIAKLAEETRLEILRHRDWFGEQVEKSKEYVQAWMGFYGYLAQMTPQAEPEQKTEQEPKAKSMRAQNRRTEQELQAAIQSAQNAKAAAETKASALEAQLREAKDEIHELRTTVQERPRESSALPADIASMAIKLALRANLRPSEVLEFFAATVPDRVVILESAFSSAAAYKTSFDGTARMLDLMHKLVFSYLDALASGVADTQARTVFGTKAYSAKESDSTMSDSRMRAMREFRYEGEKRLFERHLKVSNGTGLEGMRVYFEIIDSRVVIAYVGPHLEVVRSN